MAASPTTNISFQNFFSATLTADITSSSTDIFLDNIPNGSEGFLVIDPDSTANHEVIYYTSKTATKVVCPSAADGRGQDDTTAVAHLSGTSVIMAPIAAYFETLLSLFTTTPQGWTALAGTFTSPTYLGNRSYSFTTSTDQTSILSRGMRLRTSRTVPAPTQCTDLEASSSQYYSRTSAGITGMTFTDDFTCSAWIKLESYTGVDMNIISRRPLGIASGWNFTISTAGLVTLAAVNAANFKYVQSYQSVPLGKWVHVAATMDMSGSLGTVYIDGVLVPSQFVNSGSPTTLVQAGDLQIGARAGTEFFDGKIAQAAVFSSVLSASTIRSYLSQGLVGNESTLVSAYSFNNSINDLNTGNANNLTAQGSAVATNSDSPFTVNDKGTPGGTYDYAIVTDVTASTITCQVPEGCAIPTSGGISACSYSTYKAPFGMPVNAGKWRVNYIYRQQTSGASNATFAAFPGMSFVAPAGAWLVGYDVGLYITQIGASYWNLNNVSQTGLSNINSDLSMQTAVFGPVAGQTVTSQAYVRQYYELSAASTFTMYSLRSATDYGILGSTASCELFAEFAYL